MMRSIEMGQFFADVTFEFDPLFGSDIFQVDSEADFRS
jgi:hypothetical protein